MGGTTTSKSGRGKRTSLRKHPRVPEDVRNHNHAWRVFNIQYDQAAPTGLMELVCICGAYKWKDAYDLGGGTL